MKGVIAAITIFIFAISTQAMGQEAAPQKIVPQKAGETAPFTGLLVPEKRFIQLLDAELQAEKLKRQQNVDKKYILSLEEMYKAQLAKATQPPKWYEKPSANRWFGFTIGVIVTALAVYGGVKIVEANKDAQ